jgi:hypothetical protein
LVASDFSPWETFHNNIFLPPGRGDAALINTPFALLGEEEFGVLANQWLKPLATIVRPPGETYTTDTYNFAK